MQSSSHAAYGEGGRSSFRRLLDHMPDWLIVVILVVLVLAVLGVVLL